MRTSQATAVPAQAFPVGEFIREELEARGWTTADLAVRMGWSTERDRQINELTIEILIAVPESNLCETLARQLGLAFGTSHELWLNLERAYRVATEPKQ